MLESVAFEYAYYLKILRNLLPDQDYYEARGMGGGSKSKTWNQIKADVLNVDYYKLKGNEFGTWGAAMIAGKAAGVINDLAAHATEHAQLADHQKANIENHRIYQPLIEKHIELESMLDAFFS